MRGKWKEAQSTHRVQPFYLRHPFHSHNQLRSPDTALQLVARVTYTQALTFQLSQVTIQTLTAVTNFAPITMLKVSTSLALPLSAPLSRTQGHSYPFSN